MALQSQAPRAASSKRYAGTTRRKKGLAPWLVLAGVAVILCGLYFIFFGDGEDPAARAATPGDDNAKQDGSPTSAAAGQSPTGLDRDGTTGGTAPERATDPPNRATDTAQRQPDRQRTTFTGGPDRKLVGEAKDNYELGLERLDAGDLVAGRAILSELLFLDGALPRHEAQAVRERLAHLSEQHVFNRSERSSEQIKRDPIVSLHKVQSGEYLGPIANIYRTPYQFIERVNGIDARKLQAGQTLQVVRGPVHARIDKSDYRMDLFVEDPDGVRIYLKSFTVGLGEFDSTPIGNYRIKPGSKVGPQAANGKGPSWRNPRTGKVYDSDDPDIPIGEYWMALEGTDEKTKGVEGYGIHATNDPSSIGRQESMGCIRMRDKDVDEVFYTLFEGASTVEIVP